MSIRKKIILSVSVCVMMLVALVVGFTLPKSSTTQSNKDPTSNTPSVNDKINVEKPLTYTYQPGDILVKNGENIINYEYEPIKGMTTGTTTAYEYVFGNPMDVMAAVHLKSIDTTDVNVAYAYKLGSPLDTTTTITGQTSYTTQTIPVGNTNIYIYVLVTPTNTSIPASFTTNVKWSYGKANTVTVYNNLDNSTTTIVSVESQIVEAPLPPTAPTGYYFDAWYVDEDFTTFATFPMSSTTKLYARYHNYPLKSTTYMTYSNGSYIANSISSQDIIIPALYDDGVNGLAEVTSVSWLVNRSSRNLIEFPCTIISIPSGVLDESRATTLNFRACVNLETIADCVLENSGIANKVDLTNCVNLKSIGYQYNPDAWDIDISNCVNLESIGCKNFKSTTTSVDLSKCTKLTTIPDSMFYGCTNLTSVKLPNSITSIGANAFYNCSSLTSITIPSGVSSIPENAFYGCSALEFVNMSSCASLTSIGSSAFRYCSSLAGITIPKNVTTIGSSAFANCTSLAYAILPSELTTIQTSAFNACSVLTSITIPSKVTTIGDSAFYSCTKLATVYNLSGLTIVAGNEDNGYVAYYATNVY